MTCWTTVSRQFRLFNKKKNSGVKTSECYSEARNCNVWTAARAHVQKLSFSTIQKIYILFYHFFFFGLLKRALWSLSTLNCIIKFPTPRERDNGFHWSCLPWPSTRDQGRSHFLFARSIEPPAHINDYLFLSEDNKWTVRCSVHGR